MKKIIMGTLIAGSVLFASDKDVEFKGNLFDLNKVKSEEMRDFLAALESALPSVSKVIKDYYEAKTCNKELDMSYRIDEDTIKSNLFIDKNDFSNAFIKAKDTILQQQEFCRVGKNEVLDAENLEELIGAMRWEPRLDEQGNIIAINNYGLNVAEEDLFFTSIAPFVKTASFVEYERETYSGKQKHRFEYMNGEVNEKIWFIDSDNNGNEIWIEIV